MSSPSTDTKVFISYSHADKECLERLKCHLKPLIREGLDCWDDTHIRPGDDWKKEIHTALNRAQVAVLLISADFFASDFIDETELPPLLAAAQAKGVRILPVILGPSWFTHDPNLAQFQAVNSPDRPLNEMTKPEQERVFYKLAETIERIITQPQPSPTSFRDAEFAPEMIPLSAGSFMMGSPEYEDGRSDSEGPQHLVRIAYRFAIGRYPVTFDEWDACVQHGGTDYYSPDDGLGRNRMPVFNASWNDAQQYVDWLSKKTSKDYRLLSEAEWEYAARAGTTTCRWWGNDITPEHANYNLYDLFNPLGWGSNNKPTEVGRYPESPFHLYDMLGNIWEWVEDCWNENYDNAPNDGTAWTTGDCTQRVWRGASWYFTSSYVRSACRNKNTVNTRLSNVGFRVARLLNK